MLPKLVRDKIPDEIRARGASPDYIRISPREGMPLLIAKLHEEAEELRLAVDKVDGLGELVAEVRAEILGELCDILAIAHAVADVIGISPGELADAEDVKEETSGGFREFILLMSVDDTQAKSLRTPPRSKFRRAP